MKRIAAFMFIVLSSISVGASVLYVDILRPTNPSQNLYHTIAEAYAASIAGDEIVIYPGSYYEYTTISKDLTIRGNTQNSTKIITNEVDGFRISGGNVVIQDIVFQTQGANGIYCSSSASTPLIKNCLFENCTNGINTVANLHINISNCVFRNCSKGIYFYGNVNISNIVNCIFTSNTYGVYIGAAGSGYSNYVNVYNSLFHSNGTGINRAYANYYGFIAYNIFYTNTTNTNSVTLLEGNLLSVDPMLTNITGIPYYSYFPNNGSPCIDAGNPDISFNDSDGSRNDIGIFGGPNPWGGGKPVVLGIEVTPNSVAPGGVINIQASGQVK
jgi:hypothetical protein